MTNFLPIRKAVEAIIHCVAKPGNLVVLKNIDREDLYKD